MRILLLLILLVSSCEKQEEKDNNLKKEIGAIVDTFVRRLGLTETYCSISKESGRCFGKTSGDKVIYFVCERDIDNCLLYDATFVPTGTHGPLLEEVWEGNPDHRASVRD